MKRLSVLILFTFTLILITACSTPLQPTPAATGQPSAMPTQPALPTPTNGTADPLPTFIPAVQRFAAEKFNAAAPQVNIKKIEPVQWPDACLGAAKPGEICAQVITPGYRLQVEINGKLYELHTDNGSQVRLAGTPDASSTPIANLPPVAQAARLWLVDRLKVDLNAIQIISVTPEDWPDGCLGVRKANEMCTSIIVPGYRIIVTVNGKNMELRTNQDGKAIVIADPMLQVSKPHFPAIENVQLTWKSSDKDCLQLQLREDRAAFGSCTGLLKLGPITNPESIKELAAWVAQYQPFSAETPAGALTFFGAGSEQADPAQQRAMAEWAAIVYQQLTSPSSVGNAGLAITWERSGGIAGFCDTLKIYRSGLAVSTSCKSGPEQAPRRTWLNSAQLQDLYGWIDSLQTSSGKQTDPAIADAMTITWSLTADGARKPTAAESQKILELAAAVYSQK